MTTSKQLEIGKDYGAIFGLDASKGSTLVYLGGDKWQATKPGATKELTSPGTTAKAVEYINRPAIRMGM